jgi:hypothetical protein
VVFCLSFGSISALKFTSRSMTLVWPLEAAQSNGVHKTSFLDVKTKLVPSYNLQGGVSSLCSLTLCTCIWALYAACAACILYLHRYWRPLPPVHAILQVHILSDHLTLSLS